MSKPSALFARIAMTEAASERWLSSPAAFAANYDDWRQMNPAAASRYDDLAESLRVREFMSVREFLESLADRSRYFCCDYDDAEGAFFVADASCASSLADTVQILAVLRGAESFKDDDAPSFAYVFPALSGGDPEALLEIRRGSSSFRNPTDADPELLYFVNEAEEFIESLLEDDD